jgi:hypothetical protein
LLSKLIGKDMKNTVSESMEVLVAKSNSFKDFDFVVTAFGKAVSDRGRKGIQNSGHPVNHGLRALFETFNTAVKSTVDPFGKCRLGRISVIAIKNF